MIEALQTAKSASEMMLQEAYLRMKTKIDGLPPEDAALILLQEAMMSTPSTRSPFRENAEGLRSLLPIHKTRRIH